MTAQESMEVDDRLMAAMNARDVDAIVALFAEDALHQDASMPQPTRGREPIRSYFAGWLVMFPDLYIKPQHRFGSGGWLCVEVEWGGTNAGAIQMGGGKVVPATGRRVEKAKGIYALRVQDGKVHEWHTYPDTTGMFRQLELLD